MHSMLSNKFESYRKLVHISSISIPILYLFTYKDVMIFIMSIFLIAMLVIEYFRKETNRFNIFFSKVLNPIVRPHENINFMSATYLVFISLFIIIFIPEEHKYIAILSISYASVCDACAALYGLNFGYINLVNNKTLEGTFAFILSGIILTFLYISFSLVTFNNDSILIIFLCPFVAGLTELFTKMKYDNITVPLFSMIYLYIFIIA